MVSPFTTLLASAVPRRLFHVTRSENLPSILEHGLLTATTLVEGAGLADEQVKALLDAPRREAAPVDHPELGTVWLRDQLRMTEAGLARVLDDSLTPRDWCRLLNGMTFFFPTEKAALDLSAASQYRAVSHVLLELDVHPLVEDFGTQVKIATFNTGSTAQGGATKRRSRSSFIPVTRYQGTLAQVREVVVTADIPRLAPYLVGHRPLP
ncbi:MAG: hypothetical protein U0Q15_06735 [Kineosporiaceae bacterium]